MKAIIREQGNGFAAVGDYVTGGGDLYRITAAESRIHTSSGGLGDYVYGEVEPADWADVEDGDVHSCTVEPSPRGGVRRGAGRPPGSDPDLSGWLRVRVEPEQLERWRAAAEAEYGEGTPLAVWVRRSLDAAADDVALDLGRRLIAEAQRPK